jgi:hypothetical protein
MSNVRILKNTARVVVNTTYNHKEYYIGPKGSLTLDSVADEQAADYLLQTFNFLKEITPQVSYPVTEVKKAYGSKEPLPVIKPSKPVIEKPKVKSQRKTRKSSKRTSRK